MFHASVPPLLCIRRFVQEKIRLFWCLTVLCAVSACGDTIPDAGDTEQLDRLIMMNDLDGVRRLVAANPQSADAVIGTRHRERALHVAAYYGRQEIARYLIEQGADINAESGGGFPTPLLTAVWKNHEPLALMLLAAGADTRVPSSAGVSVCELARRQAMHELTKAIPGCAAQ